MNYEIALAVKDYLVNLAVEDRLPIDMTMLDEFSLAEVIEKATPLRVLSWGKDDVEMAIDRMNENRQKHETKIVYSDEFAEEVLNTMQSKADCGIGISWDTVEYFINYCLED